jgi:hypothetical protein
VIKARYRIRNFAKAIIDRRITLTQSQHLHPRPICMVNFDQNDRRDDIARFLTKSLFRIQIIMISHSGGLIDQNFLSNFCGMLKFHQSHAMHLFARLTAKCATLQPFKS